MKTDVAGEASTGIEALRAARSQAEKLCEIAEEARLFHTPNAEGYADIPDVDDTLPIRSKRFQQWLRVTYDRIYGGGVSNNAMQEAIETLDARACFRGEEQEVFVRIGYQDGVLYLDMCDTARRVIVVSSEGWYIARACNVPVRFRRTNEMLASPLPEPEQNGDLDLIFDFINVKGEDEKTLIRGFLLNMLHPDGPYAGLALYGEQGSAKTSTARCIRQIVDPSSMPVTGEPKDVDTLVLQANANRVPIFDNLRAVRNSLADELCRLATGSGFNKKTLYKDTDLTTIKVKRPFILTSIGDAITQADLLDRVLVVRLPIIPPGERKAEATVNAAFEQARPSILGGLLDAVVRALRDWQTVELPELPRMADLARWVEAAEPAMCEMPGTFVAAMSANKVDSYEAAINSNPVAQEVIKLMAAERTYTAEPTELYERLTAGAEGVFGRKPVGWPANAKAMSDKLKEAAPALRERHSILIDFAKSGRRTITLDAVDAA